MIKKKTPEQLFYHANNPPGKKIKHSDRMYVVGDNGGWIRISKKRLSL